MEHRISILFLCRKKKNSKENIVPVYIRITVNGQRLEHAIHRYVDPLKWSAATGRAKGPTPEAKKLNNYLDALTNKVHSLERELVQDGRNVTFDSFREKWLGISERPRMLLEIFQEHNDQMKELVDKEYNASTLERYITARDHVRRFLEWKYKIQDIDIRKLNYEFVCDYEFWLKSKRNCNHNSAIKYISNLKKVVNICIRRGWLMRDPFLGFKMTKREVVRSVLTPEELQVMGGKKFLVERLTLVRDIFLFSCFTGLAYADVKKLRRSEIGIGIDGERWLFIRRQKTETPSRVPLLPMAAAILDQYSGHPQCERLDRLLPVFSNQKMNAYLKEIAILCGIDKPLTYHIARHTFATTVTLSNGVPIESVSKMLGHKNLKTTQHYAKILDRKVSDDMKMLREKLREGGAFQSLVKNS